MFVAIKLILCKLASLINDQNLSKHKIKFQFTSETGLTKASTLFRTSSMRRGSPVTAFSSGPKMLQNSSRTCNIIKSIQLKD